MLRSVGGIVVVAAANTSHKIVFFFLVYYCCFCLACKTVSNWKLERIEFLLLNQFQLWERYLMISKHV